MADYSIAVEVDHTRYAKFARPDDREPRRIELTTIEAGQQRAVVRIFLIRGDERRLLTTFDLRGLPAGEHRPLITLTAQRLRGRRMAFRIYLDRQPRGEQLARLPAERRAVLVALLPLLVLALIAGGYFFVRTGLIGPAPPAPIETARDELAAPAPEEPEPEPEPEEVEPAVLAEREATVYFTPDSPAITPETRRSLEELAAELNAELEAGAEIRAVTLHGHTAIAGPERGRQRLSEQRAERVYAALLELGLPPGEAELEELQISGFGSSRPVTRDPEEQQRNRRVEIRIE